MSAESDFYGVISGDAGIAAVVNDRIYPNVLPDDVVFPAASYRVVTGNDVGSNGCEETRFQLDIYVQGSDPMLVYTFTTAVKTLCRSRGDYRHSIGPDLYEKEAQLHHRVIDVFVVAN